MSFIRHKYKNMSSLFEELKRRNVFRVGVAYVVVAWLIIQVIETVSEPLSLPEWTEAFFIVLLVAGLPIALLFSWAFELTPEGLKKTKDVDVKESVTAVTGKKLNNTIIIVLVLALGYFLWERQGLVEQAEEYAAEETMEITDTTGVVSVAVLPFVNMSADPEQEYFSDGISEELLNLLAKIPELRVPARTSSFQFKDQNLDIGDVAKQLNVKHVLEGSVRKADVRVRVTAQLIEADTGYHLWSETYDRELNDIFAIQDEISAEIVTALSETLGIAVEAAPHVSAAADSEAYNHYLLAQHQMRKRTKLDIESAIANYEKSLELDPDYAPAHAGIGLAWYLMTASGPTYGDLTLEESLGKALPHLDRALEIEPDLPEALGAMGLTLDAQQKYSEALLHYEKALELNPSLTDVRVWFSHALGEIGEPERELEEMETAYEMDPLSTLALHNLANKYIQRRMFERADPVLDRLEQIDAIRAKLFRGGMLTAQTRAAEGIEQILRAVDMGPSANRSREWAAFTTYNLGLTELGLDLWPWPGNALPLISNGTDFEHQLELAQKQYNEDPNNPGALEDLAFAQWDNGNREEGLSLARRGLEQLEDTARPLSGLNVMLALEAREKGDHAMVLEYIKPLEEIVDKQLASGVDFFGVHFQKAYYAGLRQDYDVVLQHLKNATERSVAPVGRVNFMFEELGWNGVPELVELKNWHRSYIESEREKLLKVACGPNGFEVWQPSDEDCGRKATTGPI